MPRSRREQAPALRTFTQRALETVGAGVLDCPRPVFRKGPHGRRTVRRPVTTDIQATYM